MAGELSRSRDAIYLAAEICGELVGYAGMWCFAGEAHIMNLAVDPDRQRRGIGEVVLLALLDRAIEAGAHAYAARDGVYKPLTKYYKNSAGDLVG